MPAYEVRGAVDDEDLSLLHARAFGARGEVRTIPWSERLSRHSLTWVTARKDRDRRLVGFVNVIGDGGAHAVLLDAVVDPDAQGCGIGRELIARATVAAGRAGCHWVHVDYTPDHADFYERVCGFTPTRAGLLRLG